MRLSGVEGIFCLLMMGLTSAGAWAQSRSADEIVCLIEPSHEVSVGTPVDGVLDEVHADRGDLVQEGQLLARLNTGIERAAVDYQAAKSDFGARKVARNQDLNTRKLISDQELDEMKTEQQLAVLELRQRKEVLNQRSILSPIRGIVVDRYRNRGDLMKQERIFRIVQIDPLHIETVVPAVYFGCISQGQTYDVKPELSSSPLKARVKNVDKVIDPASGTFRVRLTLPNPKLAVPSGQRCTAQFRNPS